MGVKGGSYSGVCQAKIWKARGSSLSFEPWEGDKDKNEDKDNTEQSGHVHCLWTGALRRDHGVHVSFACRALSSQLWAWKLNRIEAAVLPGDLYVAPFSRT